MTRTFDYGTCAVKDIKVTTRTEKTSNRTVVDAVELNGRPVKPSNRFWNSLHVRFGFTSNIFRYFSHAEVFKRISEVAPSDKVAWCVENSEEKEPTLLAVTNPAAASMRHDDLMELLEKRGAGETRYAKGVVTSEHAPRLNPTFKIAGDGLQNKFIL